MQNLAGRECHFYYEDYHRGNDVQECRLIDNNVESAPWKPKDCATCPVPSILQANSSPDLVLKGSVAKGFLGINRHVHVDAFCSLHLIDVPKPQVGCPQCALDKPGLRELFGE